MSEYDVIIVGGGPAGSTAAYQLQKDGFDVLLLDKQQFPRPKLCGGLLTAKTIRLLEQVFNKSIVDLTKDQVINYTSNYYRVFYRNKPIYEQKMSNNFYYVDRDVYDNYLLQQVKDACVEAKEGITVSDINMETNQVITDDGKEISANYIVSADGANSIIRKKFIKLKNNPLQEKFHKNMAMTIEGVIAREDLEFELEYPIIHYGVINWGYGWLFPQKKTIIIGIVGLKNKNGNFNDIFKDYLRLLDININNVKYTGWPLPYGNFISKPVFNKTFLTGDAAGLAEPITGEGIYYAQESGVLAARTIKEAAVNPELNIENYYQQLLSANILPTLRRFKRLRSFICSNPFFLQKLLFKSGMRLMGQYLTRVIQGKEVEFN